MKRASLLIVLLMVCASCFAAPRDHDWVSEGESDFTNLGVSGNSDGAPGYVKLTDYAGAEFYLWIGTDGKLRIASPLAVSYTNWGVGPVTYEGTLYPTSDFLGATPAKIKWEDASGIIIGTQSTP